MKSKWARFMTIGVLAGALMAPAALAQGRRGPGPGGPGGGPGGPPHGDPAMGPVGHALHSMELSFEQRQQIREIVHGYMTGELGEAGKALREAKRALDLTTWNAESTEAQLIEASQAVAEQAETLALARHQLALEVLGVLSAEQQAELQKVLAEGPTEGREFKRRGPGGKGGPGGPGGRFGPGEGRG